MMMIIDDVRKEGGTRWFLIETKSAKNREKEKGKT